MEYLEGQNSIAPGKSWFVYEIKPGASIKTVNHLISIGFFDLLEKGPTYVHISDNRGLFFQSIAPNFAVKGAAADI
jgi:hypothetical protein